MSQVTVSIDGKAYRMACDPGQEEHLQDLATRFDQYVRHLKESFGEIGDQRITVMAGDHGDGRIRGAAKAGQGAGIGNRVARRTRDEALQNAPTMPMRI
jgi:cell division protein ZapA